MGIEIVPRGPEHLAAVREFNDRLAAGEVRQRFGISSLLTERPPRARVPDSGIDYESFVAIDGSVIRGGYTLKHQGFRVAGEPMVVGYFQHPITEGTVDKRFALIAPRMLRHALARRPMLYALGIGGREHAAARMLASARFTFHEVPFSFHVENARRFLEEIPVLRSRPSRAIAARAAALTGLGWLGVQALQRPSPWRLRHDHARSGVVGSMGPRADPVWDRSRDSFDLIAVRDAPAVAEMYDDPGAPFIRVVVEADGELVGWAVCLATQFRDHHYFGNLQVGTIVDCLARPGFEGSAVRAALRRLREHDVDLVVTNQSFGPIRSTLRALGFLDGPSNFLFGPSPQLASALAGSGLERFHLTRGDGEGPVNL